VKTRDLVRLLNAADPTGEAECVVGGDDIYSVEKQPMYYDGRPWLLLREPSRAPYYDVIGLRLVNGDKVRIRTLEAFDVFHDDPRCLVEYETPALKDRYEDSVAEQRKDAVRFNAELSAATKDIAPK